MSYQSTLFSFLLGSVSSLAIAVPCTQENIAGEWVRSETENRTEYEMCHTDFRGNVDCSKPDRSSLRSGYDGRCEIKETNEYRLHFTSTGNSGTKTFVGKVTGKWLGRIEASHTAGKLRNIDEARKCELPEHNTLTATLTFKSGKIYQEIIESSFPEDIGDKSFFTCTMNGGKNQMILRYNDESEKPSIYYKK